MGCHEYMEGRHLDDQTFNYYENMNLGIRIPDLSGKDAIT